MASSGAETEMGRALATHDEVTDVLGKLDDAKIVSIMALKPSISDVEEASVWLSGDADVFGPGRPLKGVAAEIVAIITADEDDEAARAR
jgi:hypothetical protein